jgi:hypothetical protein
MIEPGDGATEDGRSRSAEERRDDVDVVVDPEIAQSKSPALHDDSSACRRRDHNAPLGCDGRSADHAPDYDPPGGAA